MWGARAGSRIHRAMQRTLRLVAAADAPTVLPAVASAQAGGGTPGLFLSPAPALPLGCGGPSAGRLCRGEVHARPTAGTATSRTALDQGRPFLPVSSSSSPLTPASWGPLLRPPAPRRFGFALKGARRGLSGFSASPGSSTDVTHGAGPHGLYFVECVSLFPV